MRRIFTLAIVALLIGVGVIALIETDPGYVLVSYGQYTMETSLWVGLTLLVIMLFLVYLVMRVVYRLLGGQRSLLNWMGNRKSQQAVRHSTRGMISYAEGNWDKARRQLLRGAQANDAPLLNYLLAARSSNQLNEPDKVQEYLRSAVEAQPDASTAADITHAEMLLQSGEHEHALAVLDKASLNTSKQPYVLSLMQQAYQGLGNWDKLAELLPELKRQKLLSVAQYQQLDREVLNQRLTRSGMSASKLGEIWQKVPATLKLDGEVLNQYVNALVRAGEHESAEKAILKALKQQWDSGLVRQYGLLQSENVSRRLTQAENWLSAHPQDEQLLLCLGRLSARDKLWGKARDYFESSYRIQASPEICAELGRLLMGLGEPKVAAAYFREGLMLSEDDLPTLPMPDKVVQHHHLVDRA